MTATPPGCALCEADAGVLVWRDERLRVVLPDEPSYPGFTRVIWTAHVAEMTDLGRAERSLLFETVLAVEQAQRQVLAPDKVNLASLGNFVPHLHWHVIPRWRDDPHFPQAVWAAAPSGRDDALVRRRARVEALLPDYVERIRSLLEAPARR